MRGPVKRPIMFHRSLQIDQSSLNVISYLRGSLESNNSSSGSHFSSAYALDPDPARWGMKSMIKDDKEPDDDLHNPDPSRDRKFDQTLSFSMRGLANIACLAILFVSVLMLFAGYPIVTHLADTPPSTLGAYNLGGINASGQVPEIPGFRGLIDRDTPKSAYTHTSHVDGTTYDLVFSDEFNVEGRSFYPGDDPYWEAVDLHYWVTNNIEWYDPVQVKTIGGSLRIDMDERSNHNMNYTGGMLSTWNKFCFTEGYIEANISLPGASNVYGLWPAFWLMGNLGRAGYGASLEGTWPYTYDTCDVGTLANQTDPVTNLPAAAHAGGPPGTNGEMSYLPGQRLSACTCTSESDGSDRRQMVHPGPKRADGSYVGRSAPEIDIFEAAVDPTTLIGHVSQSGQWAPFNAGFQWDNATNLVIYDHANSHLNTFVGNERQQTTSIVTRTNQHCYAASGGCFQTYGAEYKAGDDGCIQWVTDGSLVFMVKAARLGSDPLMQIGSRPVPPEPMYILLNLGMSYSFGPIDLEHLVFPAYMLVDYVRVYQPSGKWNIGCDPKDYPTACYINTSVHSEPCMLHYAD
ncbi:unnamed protein product [Rhizoctonia solani]|uniref:GH16 domain-containing protein n=1 Tax=Rhizoctonia solani TaxID=456999 RepID=A0A8H3AW68_9AGAM|nr:unnamed protein product [Rhizoctonia solani]